MVDEPGSQSSREPIERQVIEVRPPLRQRLLRGVLLVWLVLVVVFSIANLHAVEFNWIVGSTNVVEDAAGGASGGVPLVLLLAGAFASGLLTGMTVVGLRVRRARRAARKSIDDTSRD